MLAISIGVLSIPKIVRAQYGIESNYRPPVISPLPDDPNYPFYITRIDCIENQTDPNNIIYGHSGTQGSRYMDISLIGETDNGTPVYSSGPGVVTLANYASDFGNNVIVENNEVGFRYAHLQKIYVKQNQQVLKGDLIGLIGKSGRSHGSHLHWEAWQINNSGFDLMKIPGINLNDSSAGRPCTNVNVGTIDGPSISRWDSCPDFYNEAVASGLEYVVLFDHKDCRGNWLVLPWSGYAGWDLTDIFNDRARSIYIPPGFSVVISAHADDHESLTLCHSVDMWNLDEDYYDNSEVKVGWQGGDGYNMVSFITIKPIPNCPVTSGVVDDESEGRVSSYTEHIGPVSITEIASAKVTHKDYGVETVFTPDGNRLIVSASKEIKVLSVPNLELISSIDIPEWEGGPIGANSNNEYIAVIQSIVQIRDTETSSVIRELNPCDATYSYCGPWAFNAASSRGAFLGQVNSPEIKATAEAAAFTGGGFSTSRMAQHPSPRVIVIFDLNSGATLRSIDISDLYTNSFQNVSKLQFSQNGSLIGANISDEGVAVWDISSGQRLALVETYGGWSLGSDNLITYSSNQFRLFSFKSNMGEAILDSDWVDERGLTLAPDENLLILVYSSERSIQLWDINTGKSIATINTERKGYQPTVNQESSLVAVVFSDGTVKLYKIE